MSARARAVRQIGVMSLAVLLLAACTPVDRESGSKSASPRSTPAATAERTSLTEELPLPESVVCHGHGLIDVEFDIDVLLRPRPATELGAVAARAVTRQDLGPNARGMAFRELPDEWIIGEESDERVVLLRLQNESERTWGPLAAEYEMRLFLIEPEKPADIAQWYPVFHNTCTFEVPLRADAPNPVIGVYEDGEPGAMFLDLWVWEMACHGGASLEGRIELVRLREFEDRIEVAIAVAPPPEDESGGVCLGVPPTRYRVALAAPLGERDVIDLSRITPLPIPTQYG